MRLLQGRRPAIAPTNDLAFDDVKLFARVAELGTLPDTMVARRIGSLGRALYAAPEYLSRAGVPPHPDELRRHRLVTNSAATHLNHWPFVVEGSPLALAAEGFWRSNDTGLAAGMVLQGLGIGRLATVAAEPLVQQQRLPKIKACIEHWADWFGRSHATRS